MIRHTRMNVRFPTPECTHIFKVRINEPIRQLTDLFAQLICRLDDFIVDICEVRYVSNLVTPVSEITPYCIKNNNRPRIADVDVVVNGRST